MNTKNAVALVTGANRGLGKAIVKALLEGGATKVYAAARDPKSVDVQPGVVPVRLDVTKPEEALAAARELGDVTLLVNNAGISRGGNFLAADAATKAREELETNFFGPIATSQAFAPVLAKNGGGAIVNVLSVLSWVTIPNARTYSASKSAAWALTNALRSELASQKTKVLALHVGFMDTDMTAKVTGPKVDPNVVARGLVEAINAGKDEYLADGVSETVKANLTAGVYLTEGQGG